MTPSTSTPLGELRLTGAQAKALRKARGITQVDLARKLGFTQGAISQFERSPELRAGSIAALAAGYGMTPHAFAAAAIRAAEKGGRQ